MFGMIEVMMAVLMGGAGNDLLDYVQTKAYWQIKGVAVTVEAMRGELAPVTAGQVEALLADLTCNDEAKRKAAATRLSAMGTEIIPQLTKAATAAQGNPDKAGAIQQLIGRLYGGPQAGAVRRLMAIRALGELKARPALAVLKGLVKSKALFEADYAAAAVAAIEGKDYKRPGISAKELAGDIWRLPAGCGIAAQLRLPPGAPVDVAGIVKGLKKLPRGMKGEDLIAQGTKMLVQAAEMVGNIRFDALTIGVSGNAADQAGFSAVIARGKYNSKAISALIRDQGGAKSITINGIEVIKPDRRAALILPSDELLVFCSGPNQNELPLGEVTTAVKTGVGGLKGASDLGRLIKTVETSQPLWAAATITEAYRKGGTMFAAFKTMTLVGKPVKGGQAYTLKAKGTDANQVAAAVKEFTGHIDEAKIGLDGMIQQGDGPMAGMMTPMLAFLKSIKADSDGTSATVTARLAGSPLTMMVPMFILPFSGSAMEVEEGGPPAEGVIQPVPPGPVERD